MKRDRLQKMSSLLSMLFGGCIFSVVMLIVMGSMAPAFADESITIWCYEDAKSTWYLGSVSVYNGDQGAQACNSRYYECRGRCIGCYHDFDYIDNVCVDMHGNTFLK